VLENGVDFAHFKFVHQTPIVPVFTRHDFGDPISYVDFTITFEGDDGQSIDDVNSGVEAINGGLGVAVTKSWGMVDNRTITAVTPVDDGTSDVRFSVYIGRTPSSDPERAEKKAQEFAKEIIRQFTQDVHIWQHQRYSDPPALSSSEYEGFTAIRNWARQFYPDGRGGSAAELRAQSPTQALKG
jgi:3-ketosteroid 9alpha-monooxygenase subunit A